MGFGQRWRVIISFLLASSSSKILLNGSPGKPFFHKRGLRQGDPLSPMLFILAMEPLQRLFDLATEKQVLSPLKLRAARLRVSFYADDAALFVNPDKNDISAVQSILELFGNASGLRTSLEKCVAYPVACSDIDLLEVLQDFGGSQGSFPCTYLGLPLGVRKPRHVEVQPLLDKLAGRLQGWIGKLMNRTGRLALVNAVLTATAAYFLTTFPADKWLIKKIDRLRRGFLWAAEEEAKGGKCMVNWKKICAPRTLGGLGIKDIECFGRALRLRWEWLRWADEDRPWKGMATPCDATDKSLFAACTTISIGNGEKTSFWNDRWLDGQVLSSIPPELFKLARRKQLSVKEGLVSNRWMRGLNRICSATQLNQFVGLWTRLQHVQLSSEPDKIHWNLTADGAYSAQSAYAVQFHGRLLQPELDFVWKIRLKGK